MIWDKSCDNVRPMIVTMIKNITSLLPLSCALVLGLTATIASAQTAPDMIPPSAPTSHAIPMIHNDVKLENRRQGAKCMNAYPEDHGAFTDCINHERGASAYPTRRPQLLPIPAKSVP